MLVCGYKIYLSLRHFRSPVLSNVVLKPSSKRPTSLEAVKELVMKVHRHSITIMCDVTLPLFPIKCVYSRESRSNTQIP